MIFLLVFFYVQPMVFISNQALSFLACIWLQHEVSLNTAFPVISRRSGNLRSVHGREYRIHHIGARQNCQSFLLQTKPDLSDQGGSEMLPSHSERGREPIPPALNRSTQFHLFVEHLLRSSKCPDLVYSSLFLQSNHIMKQKSDLPVLLLCVPMTTVERIVLSHIYDLLNKMLHAVIHFAFVQA